MPCVQNLVLLEQQPLRTKCLRRFPVRVVERLFVLVSPLVRRRRNVLDRIKRLLQGATSLTLIEALHRCPPKLPKELRLLKELREHKELRLLRERLGRFVPLPGPINSFRFVPPNWALLPR